VSGTNTQAGMGFPATGRKIESDGVTIFRFEDGKICEEWNVFDMLTVMRQAGLLPPGTGVLSPEK
jgi:predicted ester cyclase